MCRVFSGEHNQALLIFLRAAGLTVSNVAHVIFLTTDASFSKSLSKALPDRVFRQIPLGDCSPEVAKRLVISHLDADSDDAGPDEEKLTPSQRRKDLGELDECIGALGGRLTDLEFLARRMKTGESPSSKFVSYRPQGSDTKCFGYRSRAAYHRAKCIGDTQNVPARRRKVTAPVDTTTSMATREAIGNQRVCKCHAPTSFTRCGLNSP